MDKKQRLSKLKEELESRKDIPLVSSPRDVVFGAGNPDAEIMFIGEAAGYWESVQRKPFVGPAGRLLIQLIEEVLGVSRDEVYITNVVKARPPNNRDPLPKEIEAFSFYLDQEIEIMNPKLIVTLGRFSLGKFLPDAKISSVHGKPREVEWKGRLITVLPLYHPAAALRSGKVLGQLREDFSKIPEVLKNIKTVVEQESLL